MGSNEAWLVRPMAPAERATAGQIIAEAFADVYGPALGNDPVLAAALAAVFPTSIACYVGEREGQLCGAGLLSFSSQQSELGFVEEQAIWRLLRTRQSFARAIRSRILLSLPAAPSRADRLTAYISSLAVSPVWQGQGLGTAMLTRMEEVAQRAGKTGLALHVADTNQTARRLYERRGFQVVKVERSLLTRRRWGYKAYLYMVKQLTEPRVRL